MKGIPSFRNQKKLKKRSGSVMVAQETSNTSKSNGSSDLVQESAIRDFLEKFDKESEDSNMLNFEFLEIRKEQTSFQATEEFRCSVGQKIAHFVRNRYRDILPYDKTRVLLSASPDNADGYINASHISHPDTSYMYIAAQAPLSSTVEDFWQMAFEQNATIVGMLCKCVENGMPKCERYWGDDEANRDICDNISAYTIEEKAFEDFAYRKLKVSSEKYGVTDKVIHQLHYTEWLTDDEDDVVDADLVLIPPANDNLPVAMLKKTRQHTADSPNQSLISLGKEEGSNLTVEHHSCLQYLHVSSRSDGPEKIVIMFGGIMGYLEFRRYVTTSYLRSNAVPPYLAGRKSSEPKAKRSKRVTDAVRYDGFNHWMVDADSRPRCAL